MGKGKQILLLVFLIMLLFVINYSFLDSFVVRFLDDSETGVVGRVIDGDTLVIGNQSVRLLGINSPERGEKYYEEAKKFLENAVLNKTVELEFGRDKYDLYKRKLAYIYYDNRNVNLEIVKEGYANFYFLSGKDKHYNDFSEAWNKCIDNNRNLCEKSKYECANCIVLKELDVKEQKVVLENVCAFDCSLDKWTIKDEGRKKFVFNSFILKKSSNVNIIIGNETNSENTFYWKEYDYVWTSSSDSLFLRDDEGKLVLWKGY